MYLNTHNITIMTYVGNNIVLCYIMVDVRCGCCGGRNNVPAVRIVPTNYYYIRRPTLVREGGNGKARLHPTLVVGLRVVPMYDYIMHACEVPPSRSIY